MKILGRIFAILLSVCVVCLPVYLWLYGQKPKQSHLLTRLIQKTPTKAHLSPRFFSDYLSLSPSGKKIRLSVLDAGKIQKKLSQFPIFSYVEASITDQGALILNYELREPLFYLGDFSGVCVDAQGYLFPLKPFFSPKTLPKVWLGIDKIQWQQHYSIELAVKIIEFFDSYPVSEYTIQSIDLSKLTHSIAAHHEIIVEIAHQGLLHILRIHPERIQQALKRYVRIFDEPSLAPYQKKDFIFDARIKKFATLKPFEVFLDENGSKKS